MESWWTIHIWSKNNLSNGKYGVTPASRSSRGCEWTTSTTSNVAACGTSIKSSNFNSSKFRLGAPRSHDSYDSRGPNSSIFQHWVNSCWKICDLNIREHHLFQNVSNIFNGVGSYSCERRALGSDLVRCSLYWLSFLASFTEILWDSAWHGPSQCVKIPKSKGQNGFVVLPEKNIRRFDTYLPDLILLKHHIKWPLFCGTFWLLPSSGAGGWRRRNCHCTSWPMGWSGRIISRSNFSRETSVTQTKHWVIQAFTHWH